VKNRWGILVVTCLSSSSTITIRITLVTLVPHPQDIIMCTMGLPTNVFLGGGGGSSPEFLNMFSHSTATTTASKPLTSNVSLVGGSNSPAILNPVLNMFDHSTANTGAPKPSIKKTKAKRERLSDPRQHKLKSDTPPCWTLLQQEQGSQQIQQQQQKYLQLCWLNIWTTGAEP